MEQEYTVPTQPASTSQQPSEDVGASQSTPQKDSGKKALTIILLIVCLIILIPVVCFLLSLFLGWKLSETELESTFKIEEQIAAHI